ncbi:MAG: hypothetical protein F6J97_01250 [Leptolyngbya sp. SIO4C1]|nr:hypothetical protein [Leptolyngbya sp. SIO4C1]
MPAIYLYAFCLLPGDDAALDGAVLGNSDLDWLPPGLYQTVRLVSQGRVGAVIEADIDLTAMQQDDAQLVTAVVNHDRVICDLFETLTLLPLRFGTQFVSEAALRSHLQSHATDYQARLQSLVGKAEYCLKLAPLVLPTDQAAPAEQQLTQLQDALRQTFLAVQFESSSETSACRAYLLTEQSSAGLQQTVEAWQVTYPLWDISLSEARPPYHFAN